MKEVLLMKIDGARLSACENGLFFDCDAGTILILWEQIEAAQQSVQPTDGESAPLQALSTPEVLSIGGADTTPPTIG